MEAKGLGRSATLPPAEASSEAEVKPDETPDRKPGFVVLVLDRRMKQLKRWLVVRIRKGVIPYPRTHVFDALPREMAESFLDVKDTVIAIFSSSFKEETVAFVRGRGQDAENGRLVLCRKKLRHR